MDIFKGKRILYISPNFFGYERLIKEKLESFGSVVDYFDDRPSNDFFTKVCIRLKLKFLVNKKVKEYYKKIMIFIQNKHYDYIFIVSPETFSFNELKIIKDLHPHAKSILYMWDSFENKNSLNCIKLFDEVFSFDNKDVLKYNLSFLPLFYHDEYSKLVVKDYELDLTFIATAHSDRYKIMKQIQNILANYNCYSYFYLPSKIMYYIRKYFIPSYEYKNIEEFNFKSLSHYNIIELFGKSKVIVDINHPSQNGLTMRTLECIGARKKLITTNQNIIEYDFYNPNNIMVIDRHNICIDKVFLDLPYEDLDKDLYEKYSIENWLKTIFQGVAR